MSESFFNKVAGLSWANLQISEVKMAKLGLFTGNVIFLRYILAINDFDIYVYSEYLQSMFHLWRNQFSESER